MYGNQLLVLTFQIPWSNQASKMVDKVVVQLLYKNRKFSLDFYYVKKQIY